MQNRISQEPSKKPQCQLSDLIPQETVDRSSPVHLGVEYDTFIYKDGFTQSSYTFHKLKQFHKGHKQHPVLMEAQGLQNSSCSPSNGYKQVMSILENIKKYRNRQILKRSKQPRYSQEGKYVRANTSVPNARKKMRIGQSLDKADRSFFRSYLYEGTPFELKDKTLQRLRLGKTTMISDKENESLLEQSQEYSLLEQADEKRKADQRERLQIDLEDQFRTTYMKECKEIESDIKIRFGRMSRYLIEPPPSEKNEQAVVSQLIKKQLQKQQKLRLIESKKDVTKPAALLEPKQFMTSKSALLVVPAQGQLIAADHGKVERRWIEKYFTAVRQSNIIELEFCVRARPQLVHCRDEKGNTALHLLAKSGDVGCVRYLLSRGCNPTMLNSLGRAPADIASHFDNTEASSLMSNHLMR